MTEEKSFTYDDLYPYQKVGVEFLLSKNGVLLADEMGTGKTVQAASALQKLKQNSELKRGLIVVPASLKINWYQEIRRWAPSCKVRLLSGSKSERNAQYISPINLLIASYEQVRDDFFVFPPETLFDVVILDEAQRAKDSTSDTSIAISRIRRKNLWALTGTPLENRVSELVNIISLIRPELKINEDSDYLLDALYGHFLRRKKSELFSDLGEIISKTIYLELGRAQRNMYDELWNNRHERVKEGWDDVLALITQLKKLCNYCEESKQSSKIELLNSILENAVLESGKIIVFSQYVETLRFIKSQIDYETDIFHGGLSIEERQDALSTFANSEGSSILLISLHAGGVGLNIPDATHVVMFDRWWNPQLENQAIHRAHRLDRSETLLVYKFAVTNSIEERILELLHAKTELFDKFIGGATIESQITKENMELLLDL